MENQLKGLRPAAFWNEFPIARNQVKEMKHHQLQYFLSFQRLICLTRWYKLFHSSHISSEHMQHISTRMYIPLATEYLQVNKWFPVLTMLIALLNSLLSS
jgi:hypothetical protein